MRDEGKDEEKNSNRREVFQFLSSVYAWAQAQRSHTTHSTK